MKGQGERETRRHKRGKGDNGRKNLAGSREGQ